MVKDLIDSRIRSELTLPGAIRFPLSNSSCVTLAPHEANLLAILSPSSPTMRLRSLDQSLTGRRSLSQ